MSEHTCSSGKCSHWDQPEFRWTLGRKATCAAGLVAFSAMHIGFGVAHRLRPHSFYAPDAKRAWALYLWLASYAWPWGDWRTR